MAESEEELKSLLMKAKEKSEKAGLQPSIQKTKIMASSPLTSRRIDGERKWGHISFSWLQNQCRACSHEIKRCLNLGRKAMSNLDGVLKSRDITLPTKVHVVKAMVFPVVMYGCESWTIRLSAKELPLLNSDVGEDSRVPWTTRRSNQSILKEISPEYSLERLMLKLKLHYFGHLMRRADPLEKTLMLGKIEGKRRRG